MTKFLRISLLISAFVATPALAQPPAQTRVVVSTAGLDLASAAGQRALDRRLAHAVIEACGTASDADLVGQNEVRDCRVAARSRVASTVETRMASGEKEPIVLAVR